MAALATLPPTISSRIHSIGTPPEDSTHPFAAEASTDSLRELVQSLDQVTQTLSAYTQAAPFTNPKLISLLRQHAAIGNTVFQSGQAARNMVQMLRKRTGRYGMDAPIDPVALVQWCITRLEEYPKEAGMEVFKDEQDGKTTLTVAGKLVVIDVELIVHNDVPERPRVQVSACKTQYADATGATTPGTPSIDAFLKQSIVAFLDAVQLELYDPLATRRLGDILLAHIRYLDQLDKLAEIGGLAWFTNVDQLGVLAEELARRESEIVASSLAGTRAPLDAFLMRAHALPLPCLKSPTLAFLVHLSPRAYLSLLRSSSTPDIESARLPSIDIPLSTLRTTLTAHPRPAGAALATLRVVSSPPNTNPSPSSAARPTFPLSPEGSTVDHVLPVAESQAWVLDFTDDGTTSGIVMSQSRMREVESLVDVGHHEMGHVDPGMMSFGIGSWVDLLLNPANPVSPERYTSLYRSPTSAHPPLQLRLTAPQEPGLHLQRIRVRNAKEIWGVLEIVREQCWINEILTGCHWTTDGLTLEKDEEVPEDTHAATEKELQSVLNGTITPRKIPVNVYIPMGDDLFTTDDAFGVPSSSSSRRLLPPQIVMSSPERPPMSGLVEITVAYDETRSRGVEVVVKGAMGSDVKNEVLEESVRRGGTLGLSGRVWASTS